MGTQLTVTLPDEVYREAEKIANRTGRTVNEIATSMLNISLSSLNEQFSTPIEQLDDATLLAQSRMQMDDDQQQLMSTLLEKESAGTINDVERLELSLLMYIYDQGSLRKAEALEEAVRRGLRQPLNQ